MSAMMTRRFFLGLAGTTAATEVLFPLTAIEDSVPATLDHIILGCSDLDAGIEFMEKKSGYRAAIGGAHPGRGTRNALLALGGKRYLEILAPDPEQNALTWHKEISQLTEPMLVGWAVRSKDLAARAARLRARGVQCIGPIEGSRTRPDGEVFRWKTLVLTDDKSGIRPFYIEWDEHSPHPSSDAPGACLLTDFHNGGHLIEAPAPHANLKKMLRPGDPVQLHAKIAGLTGEFELTSKAIPSEAWTTR
jgi:hypothetical protein